MKAKLSSKFVKQFGVAYNINPYSLNLSEKYSIASYFTRMKLGPKAWRIVDDETKEFYRIRNDVERMVAYEMFDEYNNEVKNETVQMEDYLSSDVKGKEFRKRVFDFLKNTKLSNNEPFPIEKLLKVQPIYNKFL